MREPAPSAGSDISLPPNPNLPMTTRPDRSPFLAIGVAFLAVAAFTAAFGVTGALHYGWRTSTLVTLVRALPVPVARADGHFVTYREWDDLRSAQRIYQDRLATVQGATAPSMEEIGRQALDASVRLAVTEALARHYEVHVSTAEVQQQLQRSIDLAANPGTLERVVRQYYGWDVATLIRVVIEPYLLRTKVDEAVATDTSLGEDPQAKVNRVRTELLSSGADFAAIANRESDDPATRATGGSTLITRTTFTDAAITDALFALAPGDISAPLTAGSTYYLVRVDQVLKDDASGENVLQAHVIVIRQRTVDTVVTDHLIKKPPKIWLAPYTWDAIGGCIVSPDHGCATN